MTHTRRIRWGIMGLGAIARSFATGLRSVPDATLGAVGSRSKEKADAFAREFGAVRAYGSYEELAADPEVDVVYVATPHPMHHGNALQCITQGKAVLLEKPFTMNAREAESVIAAARERGVFLMEAMWTRFLPIMVTLRRLLTDRAIGDVHMVKADFGFCCQWDPLGRLLNPALGGGALLDVGVYPVSFASMLLGPPVATVGLAHIGETGVDERCGMVLRFERGELAVLSAACRTQSPQEADILGTDGRIRVHSPWWMGNRLTITRADGQEEVIEAAWSGNGYNYEALEVMECMYVGRQESTALPLDETLQIMRTLDELRSHWNLRYPSDG